MKIRISKKQVHQFGEELQFDIQFVEYPDLPTYGMQVPLPIIKEDVQAAIKAKIIEVKQQIEIDAAVRNQLADFLDTNLEFEV